MPDFLVPGVYVEDTNGDRRSIKGASTSVGAIVGPTERGPLAPQMVTSWPEFQRTYGGFLVPDQGYAPYAVRGFFKNGGRRLYVGRVVGKHAAYAARDVGPLHIQAIGPGDWGDRIWVRIGESTDPDASPESFRLTLLYYSAHNMPSDHTNIIDPLDSGADRTDPNYFEPDHVEDYDNLILSPRRSNHFATKVNAESQLVRVWLTENMLVPIDLAPVFTRISNGTPPGDPIKALDFIGNLLPIFPSAPDQKLYGQGQGLAAIGTIDEVSLLMTPDEVNDRISDRDQITRMVIAQCERLKNRFAIVSAPRCADSQALQPPLDTRYGAFYYPWIQVFDPETRGPVSVPSSGHIMGIFARTERQRGIHKAPANQVVNGVLNLDIPVTQDMQDVLNPRGVNCIRDFRPEGGSIRLWGARTMSTEPQWKHVPIRRLMTYIEVSIERGMQWVVFESNGEALWVQVRSSIEAFLMNLWRCGALLGERPENAFFVRCDRSTMTQNELDNGVLVIFIGVALIKPAEFLSFRISQKTADAVS